MIQEKEFERVGGTETVRTDLRLITATNKDLEKEVRDGRFREDLYYRLNVVPIFLPALRERREDIPVLVNHFREKACRENNKQVPYISEESMEYLMNYSWPGNVRELENAIERAVVLCKADTLKSELFPIPHDAKGPGLLHFNPELPADSTSPLLPEAVETLEKRMIETALKKTDGNQRRAAKLLGLTERMIGYKIKTYGLKVNS